MTKRKPTASTNSRTIEAVNNYARGRSKRALEIIGSIMEDETAPTAVRLKAAEMMLDRAIGKPTMKVEKTVDINIQQQHLEALKNAADLRLKAIQANKDKVHYVERNDQITIEHVDGDQPAAIHRVDDARHDLA